MVLRVILVLLLSWEGGEDVCWACGVVTVTKVGLSESVVTGRVEDVKEGGGVVEMRVELGVD